MKRGCALGFVIGVLVAVAAVIALSLPRSSEPTYKGRTLSAWLSDYGFGNAQEQSHAVIAIQKIGTNALPWLLKWRNYDGRPKQPVWKARILSAVHKSRLRLLWKVRIQRRIAGPGNMYAESLWGFGILGSAAKPAIPELSRLARTSESYWALFALGKIGLEAVPALMDALDDPATPLRFEGFRFICADNQPDVPAAVVPRLVGMLDESDNRIVLSAAHTLARLKEETQRAASALAQCLESGDANIRYNAAEYLSALGTEGSNAVPQLLARLADPERRVREAATNALRSITPELLATNRVNGLHE
jgi:HEAT repeat protein/PBS lyase HEAT-like repeat-containing protein